MQRLTSLRHRYPILRRNLFLNGEYIEELGVKDVTWVKASGEEMDEQHWNDGSLRCFGMLLDGRAQTTGIRQRGKEATLLIVINGYPDARAFTLPEYNGTSQWCLLADTTLPDKASGKFETRAEFSAAGRSVALFSAAAGTA